MEENLYQVEYGELVGLFTCLLFGLIIKSILEVNLQKSIQILLHVFLKLGQNVV